MQLNKLDLSSNMLTSINKSHLRGLQSLKDLRLSQNRISSIDDSTFKGLLQLVISE